MNEPGEQVVLVTPDGTPVGVAEKSTVHSTDTPLHLAFSCYLFDERGRVLMTRRALAKATWPGVWTNTCCGHPQPGETPADAVVRRLHQELGLRATDLRLALPDFAYRAVDSSGLVENEVCPVWVGRVGQEGLTPEPAEVMDTTWIEWDAVISLARSAPRMLSPWCVLQICELGPTLAVAR